MKTSQSRKKVLSVIALLVVTMISSNSCKKENLAIFPSTTRAQSSGIAMETVDFAKFSSSVTLTKRLQPPNPTQVINNGNKEFKKQSGSSIQKGC